MGEDTSGFIGENLEAARKKISAAASASGRDASGVDLIAVSKTQSEEAVKRAIAAGQTRFGENRVQEAIGKFAAIKAARGDLELHLIGHLQTNKAAEAVAFFDVIQTVDRPKLAACIAEQARKQGRCPRLYVEVNVGNESQKAGVSPEALPEFLRLCREEYGLEISGLMCIPPQTEAAEPHFRTLKKLADEHGLKRLSMGMSADFEEAIACGATEVRIGTAIFGRRG